MKISYKIILVGLLSIFLSLSFLQCDPLCEGSPDSYTPTEYDDEGRVKKADIMTNPFRIASPQNCHPYKGGVRVYSYYANGNIKTEIDYLTDEIYITNIECYNIDNSKDQCHPLTHNLANEYTSLAYYDSGETKLKSYIIYHTPEKTSMYIEYTYYESNGNLKTEIVYYDTKNEDNENIVQNDYPICYDTDGISVETCSMTKHGVE